MPKKINQINGKDKIILSEKGRDALYCVLFLLVLLFLAFGDQIAMRFLKKQPNPNTSISRSEHSTCLDYFPFVEVSLKEVLEKIEAQESFLLLSTRENCYTCKKYVPLLKTELTKYNISIYYINRSFYDSTNEDYLEFVAIHEDLQQNMQYTPYVMYFENGNLQDELVGSQEANEIYEFLERNNLEENKI